MSEEPENPYEWRRDIDGRINWRRNHRAFDTTPIRVHLTPSQVLRALGYPIPRPPQEVPARCLYRGYAIEARLKEPSRSP